MIVGMTTIIDGIAGLKDKVGEHLGYSDYVEITQEQVNLFADATGDHQWIHVDPERAKKESPFGGPIAHGYLTLSLGPMLAPQIMRVDGVTMAVNYGCEKVRFPSPVPVGSKVRLGAELTGADDIAGGAQVTMRFTFEVEGAAEAELRGRHHLPLLRVKRAGQARPRRVDLVHGPRPCETTQADLHPVGEGQVAGGLDELLRQRRHEHLPRVGLRCDAGGRDHVAAEHVTVALHHLAGVQPGAEHDRPLGAGGGR